MSYLDFFGIFDFAPEDTNVYEYTSNEFTTLIKGLSGTGIAINEGDKFACTANRLEITVGSGMCFIQGRWGYNEDETIITLDAESVSLQRIDRIVLFVDVTNRTMGLKVVKGSASSSPAIPDLTQEVLYYEIPVYRALITDGSTVTLTDERVYVYTPTEINQYFSSKQNTITGAGTTITNDNLTASRTLVSNASGKIAVSSATSTELGYLSGVTSAVQTQLNGKQASITGGATSITSNNLTASRALVSDASGKVAVSAVTSTELGYLDGVTSAIQTQLNGKAASSHTQDISTINGLQTALNGKEATLNAGQKRKITINTANPSGGVDGDIWIKVVL